MVKKRGVLTGIPFFWMIAGDNGFVVELIKINHLPVGYSDNSISAQGLGITNRRLR